MRTKLLYLLLVIGMCFGTANAQTISIVGEAVGGWPDDNPETPDTHIMSTTDNITYTLSGLTVSSAAPGGGAKFRQDGAWTFNWGSAAFPSGTGTQNGSNILTVAGTYDITFNRLTGAYNFEAVGDFQNVGIIGTAVNAGGFDGPDQDMVTFDGITYTLVNHTFTEGEAKFRLDDSWTTSWGNTAFPSGVATVGGANIPVPAGVFTVTFNIQTGQYSFEHIKIGILGTAVSAGGFDDPDTNLSTTDGVNYILNSHTFTDGLAKFRQDDSWAINWGSPDFPTGTGTLNGPDIPVTAGTYSVTFNRITGAFAFGEPIAPLSIGILGNAVSDSGFAGPDVDLTTEDGVIYILENYSFSNGAAKFRVNDTWDLHYGGTSFPTGDAVQSGDYIYVIAGTYTVMLNINTMTYAFIGTPVHPTVGIIGTAVSANGFNGLDYNMFTTDGEIYTMSHTFLNGEAKFRQDDAWTISWGSNAFPDGTNDGNNILIPAGTYNVTFNRTTGAYSFAVEGTIPSIGIIGTAVTAGGFTDPDTNMDTTNGIIYTLTDWPFTAGSAKFRQDDAWDVNWGSPDFPSGTATLNGPDIAVTAGNYDVTFNRLTGAFSFNGDSFPMVGMIGDAVLASGFDGDDVDMTTSDGINYNLDAHDFTSGSAKFRQDNGWAVNWGSDGFPSGTGVQNGANIPVVGNRYNVWFDRTTGAYAFNYVSLGVLGTALGGFDVADEDMSTNDGINYFLDAEFTAGLFKIRENDKWDVNWGGTYVEGGMTLTMDGPDINLPLGGLLGLEFNRLTGLLQITYLLDTGETETKQLTIYPNPSSSVWNFSNASGPVTHIDIMDISGKLIISKTISDAQAFVDASALPAGMYFAKVKAGGITETHKLIKK